MPDPSSMISPEMIELGGRIGVGSVFNRRARLSPTFVKVLRRRIRVMRSILHQQLVEPLGKLGLIGAAARRLALAVIAPADFLTELAGAVAPLCQPDQ